MKKVMTAAVCAMLMCVCACTKQETPAPSAEPTPEATAAASEAPAETPAPTPTETPAEALGAWEVFGDAFDKTLADPDKEHFAAAMEGLTGVGYTPIAVLARQVVSGENTAFLALGTQVTAEADKAFYVVTVYTNTEGKSSVTVIKAIDLTDIHAVEEAPAADLLGGWTVEGHGRPGSLTAESEKALQDALSGMAGVRMMPVTLLGSQVVSGMNYMYLLTGSQTASDTEDKIYVAEVYVNTEGKAETTVLKLLDLLYYVTE
ncbi:MAG: hypothetical protein IJJ29_08135 [Solobacterium sp.]|nr:hypothetical protein [Solobacterium sp.]